MGRQNGATSGPSNWPEPDPNQTEVCLLGCYHMDQPGNDAVNVDVDDVLAADRQREIERLVDRLATWDPDLVAVERPADEAADLEEFYREFRTGERRFDEPDGDGPVSVRSEVVQVGFRLATELGHERVYPVDDRVEIADRLGDSRIEALDQGDLWIADEEVREATGLPDPEAYEERISARLAESTVTEFLRW